jgi:hypothetical protein
VSCGTLARPGTIGMLEPALFDRRIGRNGIGQLLPGPKQTSRAHGAPKQETSSASSLSNSLADFSCSLHFRLRPRRRQSLGATLRFRRPCTDLRGRPVLLALLRLGGQV